MVEPTHRSRHRTAVRSPTWTSVGFVRPHSAVRGRAEVARRCRIRRGRRPSLASRQRGPCPFRRSRVATSGPAPSIARASPDRGLLPRMLVAAAWQGQAGRQARGAGRRRAHRPGPERGTRDATNRQGPGRPSIGSQPPDMLLAAASRRSGAGGVSADPGPLARATGPWPRPVRRPPRPGRACQVECCWYQHGKDKPADRPGSRPLETAPRACPSVDPSVRGAASSLRRPLSGHNPRICCWQQHRGDQGPAG